MSTVRSLLRENSLVPAGPDAAHAALTDSSSTRSSFIAIKLLPLLLLLTCSIACNRSSQKPPADEVKTAVSPIPFCQTVGDAKVSAVDLTAAYSNEAEADKLYKGRLLEISGQVESILLDGPAPVGSLKEFTGQTLVFFQGQTVACLFEPGLKAAAAQLQGGQSVTLVGRLDRRYASRVVLRDCCVKRADRLSAEKDAGSN
jgi:hypothetical protein